VSSEGKPWDARLIERMQRGSSSANSGRRSWDNKSRTLFAAYWVILGIAFAEFWYCAVAGVGVVVFGVLWSSEPRRN